MRLLISLVLGSFFGAALALSGMTDTAKVLGFLDLFGAWDITLMFVMAGGLLLTIPAYHAILKWRKPLLDNEFYLPSACMPDRRLILGSCLFGIGWGLYGYCPGPAISALSYQGDSALFVVAMLGGMFLASRVQPG